MKKQKKILYALFSVPVDRATSARSQGRASISIDGMDDPHLGT
jgi:hypothetical protein